MDPKTKWVGCGCLLGMGAAFLISALVFVIALTVFRLSRPHPPPPPPPPSPEAFQGAGDASLTQLLEPIRRRNDVPALIAAVVTSDGLQRAGVVGVRKRGTDIAATPDDLWHLGSDTKAMTAALIARLVERGQLAWDTRLKDVFSSQTDPFQEDLAEVTLRQLLAHRSGLPRNLDLNRYQGTDVRSERARAVREYLANPPEYPPGSRAKYSNLGYIIAGTVAEVITDQPWENVMRDEVFAPLGMTSAGFGGVGTPGQIDQPWPHNDQGDPLPTNGPTVDNPPVMGPAGRVHCSIQDWAKFVTDQLRGARGKRALLQLESYQTLHAPVNEDPYALGWLVLKRDWGGGTVFHHGGDNTMNHANVWIAPHRDFAVLACCNQGGDAAAQATDQAIAAIIDSLENPPKAADSPRSP